jgi:DNA-binding PadR family transcriptional regulator
MKRDLLGEFEQIVLLAIVRLKDHAYGVSIRTEIEKRMQRSVSIGALYSTLDRLEAKGFVSSFFSDPKPERGGRARRYFQVEPRGVKALERTRETFITMWDGVDLRKA